MVLQHYKLNLPSEIYLFKIQNQSINFGNHSVVSFPHPDVNLYTSECATSVSSLNRITNFGRLIWNICHMRWRIYREGCSLRLASVLWRDLSKCQFNFSKLSWQLSLLVLQIIELNVDEPTRIYWRDDRVISGSRVGIEKFWST
jgi:hypothetical protein